MSDLEIIKTIFTEFPYALLGSVIAGILCAYLSTYIISKRIVFFGATLTQTAVVGIVIAHLPIIEVNLLIGSIIFTLLVVVLLSYIMRKSKIPNESILGIAFITAIVFRTLIIQKSPGLEASEVDSILKGDILLVSPEQFYYLLAVFIIIMTIHLIFYKEFTFTSFDTETASAMGYKTKFWELFLFLTLGIAISITTRIVGDVFVFGFLTIPAVAAILASKKVKKIIFIPIFLGFITPIIGLYLAFKFDFPAGPTTIAFLFITLLIIIFYRKIVSLK